MEGEGRTEEGCSQWRGETRESEGRRVLAVVQVMGAVSLGRPSSL